MSSTSEENIIYILRKAGFINNERLTNTLQGQIWRATKEKSGHQRVIKIASKALHTKSLALCDGKLYKINENILYEKQILKHLSSFTDCPSSIIKYKAFFKSSSNYYLSMENGGTSLFDFVIKAHRLIKAHKIRISEWQRIVKKIFKQMIIALEFMHNKGVCHFDLSLENSLINEVKVCVLPNKKIKFIEPINIKIIDFGLAELFEKDYDFQSKKYCGKRNYTSPELCNGETFNAAANDIFCIGVCLFMMLAGVAPFHRAVDTDQAFQCIINGNVKYLLKLWNKLSYFDKDALNLISSIFQFEDARISLKQIRNHPYLM